MLVLSRKAGQTIHIGSDITVSVLEISGKFIRVGIDAPQTVTILRGEVKELIERENKLAAERMKHFDDLLSLGSFPGISTRRMRNGGADESD